MGGSKADDHHPHAALLNLKTLKWNETIANHKNHEDRDSKAIILAPIVYATPYFYVFGGLLKGTRATDEISRYDVANDRWTVAGHMKHKRREHRKRSQKYKYRIK